MKQMLRAAILFGIIRRLQIQVLRCYRIWGQAFKACWCKQHKNGDKVGIQIPEWHGIQMVKTSPVAKCSIFRSRHEYRTLIWMFGTRMGFPDIQK